MTASPLRVSALAVRPGPLLALAVLAFVGGCRLRPGGPAPEPGTSIQITVGGVPAAGPDLSDTLVATAPPRPAAPEPAPPAASPSSVDRAGTGPLLSQALRQRTFDLAWRRVRDGFYDPRFNGLSWDSIGAVFRPEALAAVRSGPFHQVLARMLATLGVSHTIVLSPERLAEESARNPGWTGAEALELGHDWVVWRVAPGSPAAKARLHPGDVLDSIAGRSAEALARAGDRPWLKPNESLRARTAAVNEALSGDRGLIVRVVARDTLDRARVAQMKARAYPGPSVRIGNLPPARALFEVRRLDGGWGYIRFTAFVPALRKRIDGAIRGLHDAPGLILDLRGNPGGYDALGDHIASLLVTEPHVLTETRTRHGERIDRARPEKDGYRGPVVVLLDGLSASAAEQFAAPLQEIGRVVAVGEPSAGADLEAAVVALPTGGALMYPVGEPLTPAGRVIEGTGVSPDVEAHLSRLGLARGHDAQLDSAVAVLERRAPPRPPARRWRWIPRIHIPHP